MGAQKEIMDTYLMNLTVLEEEEEKEGVSDDEEIQKETIKDDMGQTTSGPRNYLEIKVTLKLV